MIPAQGRLALVQCSESRGGKSTGRCADAEVGEQFFCLSSSVTPWGRPAS